METYPKTWERISIKESDYQFVLILLARDKNVLLSKQVYMYFQNNSQTQIPTKNLSFQQVQEIRHILTVHVLVKYN